MPHKLIDKKTGKEILIGDDVTTFRGEIWKLRGFTPPKHPRSTGRITVESEGFTSEYYPGVIDAEIVEHDSFYELHRTKRGQFLGETKRFYTLKDAYEEALKLDIADHSDDLEIVGEKGQLWNNVTGWR